MGIEPAPGLPRLPQEGPNTCARSSAGTSRRWLMSPTRSSGISSARKPAPTCGRSGAHHGLGQRCLAREVQRDRDGEDSINAVALQKADDVDWRRAGERRGSAGLGSLAPRLWQGIGDDKRQRCRDRQKSESHLGTEDFHQPGATQQRQNGAEPLDGLPDPHACSDAPAVFNGIGQRRQHQNRAGWAPEDPGGQHDRRALAKAIHRSYGRRGDRGHHAHAPHTHRLHQMRKQPVGENADEAVGGLHDPNPRQRETQRIGIDQQQRVEERIPE